MTTENSLDGWYNFHNFPRWDYSLHRAPASFRLPSHTKVPALATNSHYYQGLYNTVVLGVLVGIIFFLLTILWNLHKKVQGGHRSRRATRFQRYLMYTAAIFTVISLGFAVASDLDVNKVAKVAQDSFHHYTSMVNTGEDVVTIGLEINEDLIRIDEKIYLPQLRKEIKDMLHSTDKLIDSANSFLHDARRITWYPDTETMGLMVRAMVLQFLRVFAFGVVFYILIMRPRWFYHQRLTVCATVYFFLNFFLILIWLWCCIILTYTIVLSDVCSDVPSLIENIKDVLDLNSFDRKVVDYYVQCAPGMESPFQGTIDDMNKYLQEAKLGLAYLKVDEQLRPQLKPEVDDLDKLFTKGDHKVRTLENQLECADIHDYYNDVLDRSCMDLKSNVFLDLIFQWSAIILIIVSRTCKWRSWEQQLSIQNDANPTILLLDGETETDVVHSANFGPLAAPDPGTIGSNQSRTSLSGTCGGEFLTPTLAPLENDELFFPDTRKRSMSSQC